MTIDYRKIILEPILNEKALIIKEEGNVYTFKVQKTANKIQIKNAVEKLFNVKVLKVNTLIRKGKVRRQGRYVGMTSDWKRAMVKLAGGQTIEAFNVGGSQ